MWSESNSAGRSVLRPEFSKKSHSRRRNIFIKRTAKKALPLFKEFHEKNNIDVTESELEKMAREYAKDISHRIWHQRREIFSHEPAEKRDFEGLVDVIVSKVKA